jgi:hypothetical protein
LGAAAGRPHSNDSELRDMKLDSSGALQYLMVPSGCDAHDRPTR